MSRKLLFLVVILGAGMGQASALDFTLKAEICVYVLPNAGIFGLDVEGFAKITPHETFFNPFGYGLEAMLRESKFCTDPLTVVKRSGRVEFTFVQDGVTISINTGRYRGHCQSCWDSHAQFIIFSSSFSVSDAFSLLGAVSCSQGGCTPVICW